MHFDSATSTDPKPSALTQPNNTGKFNTYEKCEQKLNDWLNSENMRHFMSKLSLQSSDIASQFIAFAQSVAINQYMSGNQVTNINPPEWLSTIILKVDEDSNELRNACPIQYNTEKFAQSPYLFNKNFFEYFMAKQLYSDLKNKVYNHWNHQFISRKLIVYIGRVIAKFESNDFDKYIWSLFKELKTAKQNKIIISNLLSLLTYLDFSFIGEYGDLRGLTIERTDFSGANLSNANFSGAELIDVNLTNVFIPDVKCIDTNMRLVQFSEYPTHYYKMASNCICFSKNENYMAVAAGGEIILYASRENGLEEVKRLQGHKGLVNSIVLNREGNVLVSCGEDKQIIIWGLKEDKVNVLIKGNQPYKCISISPDGDILVSGKSNGDVDMWDLSTFKHIAIIKGHSECVNSIVFTSNGDAFATAADDGKVIIYDTKKKKLISEINNGFRAVKAIAFNLDNSLLAIATHKLFIVNLEDLSKPGEVKNLETHIQHSFKSEHSFFTSVAFNLSGNEIAAGSSDGRIHLWHVASRVEKISLVRHFGSVNCVVFSPDGKWLLTAGSDKSLMQWNANISSDLTEKIGFYGTIVATTFDENNNPLALISGRSGIYLWDINNKTVLKRTNGTISRAFSAAYSDATNIAAFGCQRKSVYLLNFAKDNHLLQISGKSSSHLDLDVYCIAFNQDEKILGIAEDDKIVIWDVPAQKEIDKLILSPQQKYTIYTLAFNKNPNLLITGGSSGNLHLWDIPTKKIIMKLTGHKDDIFSVCFSPDGKLLASGGKDKVLKIWDVQSGVEIASLQKHLGAIATIVFSVDGNLIATGSNDRFVYIWDVRAHSLLACLGGHWGQITSLKFSRDGKYLLVGCGDYGAFLWVNFGNLKEWFLKKRFTNDSYLYANGAILKDVNISSLNQKLLEQYGAKVETSSLENTKNNFLLPPAKSDNTNEASPAKTLPDLQKQDDHRDKSDKQNQHKV